MRDHAPCMPVNVQIYRHIHSLCVCVCVFFFFFSANDKYLFVRLQLIHSSTRGCDCYNTQLFLSGYTASVHTYPSESGIRIRTFLNPFPEVEIFEYAMNRNRVDAKSVRIFVYLVT